ncbi:MAG TPA: sigma-70 family RNA polymerase sigma factor [Balneolaceae bacterium]|nr:sigma-70 family RNA polymerase sigma factor [Balneolaceae bacterium]
MQIKKEVFMKFTKSKHISSDYQELDDRELVQFYRQNGDEQAFAELMNRHQNKIYSYIFSMVKNAEKADDIFQETFTKVITKMDDTYNEQGKWIAWVMRIAHNATIDHIRKQKRFVDVSSNYDDESNTDFYDRLEDEDIVSAQEQLENEEDKSSLMKHIGNLPDEQRQVVMLRHYYEMPFKEIADLTDVSINTALGRMRYALINLRKMFEEEKQKESV